VEDSGGAAVQAEVYLCGCYGRLHGLAECWGAFFAVERYEEAGEGSERGYPVDVEAPTEVEKV
jgi:hypothetical protein